ncbi:hypothetical protein B0T20DRAFT_490525 [Sordaria brevicollis]|uniref:Uncharacterized protein n=1 Tax=Sordaria brevicollis TaxID=83679 RepID=A0AAE0NVK2_SORBR|nr:hypothetical protein B0T20DRAFT_490525 [Sordaria brevicollis]
MAPLRSFARNSKTSADPTAMPPKPAGVTKLLPRIVTRAALRAAERELDRATAKIADRAAAEMVDRAAARVAVKKTTTVTTATTRPATRAFTRQATALKNEVKSEVKSEGPAEPVPAPDHGSKLAPLNPPQPSQAIGADPSRASGTTRPPGRRVRFKSRAEKLAEMKKKESESAESAPAPAPAPVPKTSSSIIADLNREAARTMRAYQASPVSVIHNLRFRPIRRGGMFKPAAGRLAAIKKEESAEPAAPAPDASTSKLANVTWQPAPAPAQATAPPTPSASKGIIIFSPLQPSPIQPSPFPPHSTEAELKSLITLGRQHVEPELRDRIVEEKNRKHILAKQKTAYARYQTYLKTLTDLEDELRELKEENRLDEEMVREQAEMFRTMTMRWARMFEEYAGQLGVTVWDLERLGNAW